MSFAQQIASSLDLKTAQVTAVLELFDSGATLPFIARYRKEQTGGLDEVAIASIEKAAQQLQKIADRRQAILERLQTDEKLTPALKKQIETAQTLTELEDLYAPYKRKRLTRAEKARQKGLEPLALKMLAQSNEPPSKVANAYLNAEVKSIEEALQGARDIVAETYSERVKLRNNLRKLYSREAELTSKVSKEFKEQKSKFEAFYNFSERLHRMPSHRFLALKRGEGEGILKLKLGVEKDRALNTLLRALNLKPSPWKQELENALEDSLKRLLMPAIESEQLAQKKEAADEKAIAVFAENLEQILMAAPLGEQAVLAIDPGLRTGSKCVALDATGKYLADTVLYTEKGQSQRERAQKEIHHYIAKFRPQAIAVGNGTGSREIQKHLKHWLKDLADAPRIVIVNEAGASIYSASDIAREEFPELDLTLRGAISIGRRLQDPLSELVKIEAKSIGVGQYQHDVAQKPLRERLDRVVTSCVNQVGVEVNTASASLLSYVSGIGPSLAKKVVAHRNQNGAFHSRKALLKVSGLGAKAYEQAAGFLRVAQSKNPLDASAVHPERYALVEQIARDQNLNIKELIGQNKHLNTIQWKNYLSESVGQYTLDDIAQELQKPGRDPRASFKEAQFRDDLHSIEDLKTDMVLEGVVTNLTAFGAFVDLGVHQDGLIHVSELDNRFVRDPAEVVRLGDIVKVVVLDVDTARKRIQLSRKRVLAQ